MFALLICHAPNLVQALLCARDRLLSQTAMRRAAQRAVSRSAPRNDAIAAAVGSVAVMSAQAVGNVALGEYLEDKGLLKWKVFKEEPPKKVTTKKDMKSTSKTTTTKK